MLTFATNYVIMAKSLSHDWMATSKADWSKYWRSLGWCKAHTHCAYRGGMEVRFLNSSGILRILLTV